MTFASYSFLNLYKIVLIWFESLNKRFINSRTFYLGLLGIVPTPFKEKQALQRTKTCINQCQEHTASSPFHFIYTLYIHICIQIKHNRKIQ